MLKWRSSLFDDLSLNELYEILKVRQAVFALEQNCVYQDADDFDQCSWHLMGWYASHASHASIDEPNKISELVAYLRVVFPAGKYPEPSIGRVLVTPKFRHKNVGTALMGKAISHISDEYPNSSIRISAQQYLENFYAGLGFKTVSEPYLEDGIPHIEMLRSGLLELPTTDYRHL